MDGTHLFIALAILYLISLHMWDRRSRQHAEAEHRALLERMEQTLERVSEHTRHTGELAARATEIAARNEQLTMAVLRQFQSPSGSSA